MEPAGMSDTVAWLRRVAESTAGVLYAESGDDGVKVREMWHPTDLLPIADEIERLSTALDRIAWVSLHPCVDSETAYEMRKIAREALGDE
jgi:hypothetical protein